MIIVLVLVTFFNFSQPGPISVIYLYSIHRAICRGPSDHSVVRTRDEIWTLDGRADLVAGTLTTRPPHLTRLPAGYNPFLFSGRFVSAEPLLYV